MCVEYLGTHDKGRICNPDIIYHCQLWLFLQFHLFSSLSPKVRVVK